MHPHRAVEIEPTTEPLPADTQGLDLLRAVRGRGRDPLGLVELELDAAGDLVAVEVTDLAADQSGATLSGAFTEAFRAARDELARHLEQHAEEAQARTRGEQDASVARLQDVADRAEQQLGDILGRLSTLAERGARRG